MAQSSSGVADWIEAKLQKTGWNRFRKQGFNEVEFVLRLAISFARMARSGKFLALTIIISGKKASGSSMARRFRFSGTGAGTGTGHNRNS